MDSYDLHVISGALKWVKPAVHACHSETALGCTVLLVLDSYILRVRMAHCSG
jgi:hypothetical protein